MRILSVRNKSLGHQAGLRPKFDLLTINGNTISDNIDLRFHQSDDLLDIVFRDQTGRLRQALIEKDYDDSLGVVLEEPKFHSCGNKCIFCFVDQMPRGLRKALYFKDEDYRLSFLYGNYITLSNIGRSDLARIKQQRLSPLYISVHATDPKIRQKMLGSRRSDGVLKVMADLIQAGIELHTQIVLCPGINDGRHLEKSVSDLAKLYPGVKSIAVVPVGLTKHRQKLYPLRAIDRDYSRQLIEKYKGVQRELKDRFKKTILYFADEFYLNAGLDFPKSIWYDDYSQIDNGVGMVRCFWDDFKGMARKLPYSISKKKHILIVTGTSGLKVMRPVVRRLNRVLNLCCEIRPVQNKLLGDTVTVSGLLAGRDILESLEKGKLYQAIALPENSLNSDGRFIDDISLMEFKRRVKPAKVIIGIKPLIENILH